MQQQRTKTQNCTTVTNTTRDENTCEYGGYVYVVMIIIIGLIRARKKIAARKANRYEDSKTFRLNSTVAFQQPGAQQQRHEHCAGQSVAQHFRVGLPSQHSPGMPGVGNDV